MIDIRQARDTDVEQIRDLFVAVYGTGYPYPEFYDTQWLKRLVYDDATMIFVGELDGKVALTCSVNLCVGGMEDMVGEVGRLVALPDESVRGKGYALELAAAVMEQTADRVQFLFGEARTRHPGSQRILEQLGWAAVGYEPLKYLVGDTREGMIFYVKLQGMAAELRRNDPRVIPEAAPLAQTALLKLGLPDDVITEDDAAGYPMDEVFDIEHLTSHGLSPLLRIERGRLKHREVFGAKTSLAHGFFKISNSKIDYLVAKQGNATLGAIGYVRDPIDRRVRIIELIEFDDAVKGFLLASLDRLACEELGAAYIEVDVSAYSPPIQRTLERLGFVPVAYCPSMAFDQVERVDILRMAKLCLPYALGETRLVPACAAMKELVETAMESHIAGREVTDGAKATDLFRSLPRGDMEHLARIGRIAEHPAGTRFVIQGPEADRIFIILEGSAEIQVNGQVLAEVGAGGVFGEMPLVWRAKRSGEAVLKEPCRLIEMDIARLKRLLDCRPQLGYHVMRNLAASLGVKLAKATAGRLPAGQGE